MNEWDKRMVKMAQESMETVEKFMKDRQTYKLPVQPLKLPKITTTQDQHAYESSGNLIRHIRERVRQWESKCPKNAQPIILAILSNGLTIHVYTLSEEGHNGIMITGKISDIDAECMILSHQATVQICCFMEELKENEEKQSIGFCLREEHEE